MQLHFSPCLLSTGVLFSLDSKGKRKRRVRAVLSGILLVGVGLVLAVYVDAEFAAQVESVLQKLGLPSLQQGQTPN